MSEMGAFWGVCVLYVLIWHLMGSAGCRAARLKPQSVGNSHCPLPDVEKLSFSAMLDSWEPYERGIQNWLGDQPI